MTTDIKDFNPSEFLEFVLRGHEDSKVEQYKTQVEKAIERGDDINTITNLALVRVDVDTPEWNFIAARSILFDLYKKAGKLRGEQAPVERIKELIDNGQYGSFLLEKYTEEEINQAYSFIDQERDLLLDHSGIMMLSDRYLFKYKDPKGNMLPYELPQERWLTIALTLMQDEKPEKRMELVEKAYWVLSNLYITVATPTMGNAGRPDGQLSSCFIGTVEDSLDNIYDNNKDSAMVSKFGGGIGVYMGKIRSLNSYIRGMKGKSQGVIPWIKGLENTANSVDQLGQRKGAIAVYLDIWHKDIMEFLQIGTNNGDERRKARDVFPGLCVPDLFMEKLQPDPETGKVDPNAKWYLFDPHEVRMVMGYSLEDFYDEEEGAGTFRQKYMECVNSPLLSRTEILVKDVAKAFMTALMETGMPFMFFRDEVNRKNPNKHAGMIYCSNLCTEITQNMSPTVQVEEYVENADSDEAMIVYKVKPGDYVVCNLSSVNLGRAYPSGHLEEIIEIQVRMLDNVIDVNNLPRKQATLTNRKYRAIGLGTFGWHHLLAVEGIKWDSEESVEFADEVYEKIAYNALRASANLAKEKGTYRAFEGSDFHNGDYFTIRGYKSETSDHDWDTLKEDCMTTGIRNAHVLAVAPNGNTALIAGSTQGIDAFYTGTGIYYEEKKDFKIPVIAPDMSTKTFPYYWKNGAFDVSHEYTIRQNAMRQKHIDQSVSFNIYIKSDIKFKDILNIINMCWKNKLKTTYYFRGQSNDIEDCVSCT